MKPSQVNLFTQGFPPALALCRRTQFYCSGAAFLFFQHVKRVGTDSAPRGPQEGSKRAPRGPQEGPKRAPRRAQDGFWGCWGCWGSWGCWGLRVVEVLGSGGVGGTGRRPVNYGKNEDGPRWPQEGPKRAQVGPKRAPKVQARGQGGRRHRPKASKFLRCNWAWTSCSALGLMVRASCPGILP